MTAPTVHGISTGKKTLFYVITEARNSGKRPATIHCYSLRTTASYCRDRLLRVYSCHVTETFFHEKWRKGKENGKKKKKKRMENRRKWENETSSVTKLACSPANLRYVTPRIVLREQITFVEFLLCHRIVCRFVCNVRAWLMYAHSTLISSTLGKLKMMRMNNYHFAFVFDYIFNSNE